MRVSQQMIFTNFINQFNHNARNLIDLNIQASSQKRINTPSDDPVGTARVLDYRHNLTRIGKWRDNIDTARGWLGLADETLLQVSTNLTRLKELGQQGATGTLTADNREQISFEARQIFKQFISLANTTYQGNSIFAGHNIDENAYQERLWLRSNDESIEDTSWSLTPESGVDDTILIQVTSSGAAGSDVISYRYSTDGGDNFTDGTMASNATSMNVGAVSIELEAGTEFSPTALDDTNDTSGTWLYVYPTAEYKGDNNEGVWVDDLGVDPSSGASLSISAQGTFSNNVSVRIDNTSNASLDENIQYSYSLDGGATWVEGNTASNGNPSELTLSLPGGLITIASNGGNTLQAGGQFVLRPSTANIEVQISANEDVPINSVGLDIFGGVFRRPGSEDAEIAFASNTQKNLFDAVGRLVSSLETNNQQGVQKALDAIDQVQSEVMVQAADIGGRENRLEIADNVLSGLEINDTQRMSRIEDIDVGELMTNLSQAQIAYESVLKSSSNIMRMSLTKYI